MTEKTKIIAALGEAPLALPAQLGAACAAAQRLRQMLGSANTTPEDAPAGLDKSVEASPPEKHAGPPQVFFAPPRGTGGAQPGPGGAQELLHDLDAVFAPLAGEAGAGELAAGLDALRQAVATARADESADAAAVDLVRRLSGWLGDAAAALQAVQARHGHQLVSGASVYGLDGRDRQLVTAFMGGLHKTASLKFDHPGLGTIAARAGEALLIQNDIGSNEAQVLVLRLRNHTVSITYTDVHAQRLAFFQSLLERYDVLWGETLTRNADGLEEGVFHLCQGNFTAWGQSQLEEFMAFLGSRLVYLIDWNRARKRLRQFLPKEECVELLKWAADQNYGHRAFLQCGGERMLFDALEFVGRGSYRYGEQLHDMLGQARAQDYMRFVLRSCAEGLLANRPCELIHDQVRAELFGYFRSAEEHLLDIAEEHGQCLMRIAAGLRDAWAGEADEAAGQVFAANAAYAGHWESQADDLEYRARLAIKRSDAGHFYQDVVVMADDVADALEEAAFHLTLLPASPAGSAYHRPMAELMELALAGAQEYLQALGASRKVRRNAPQEDIQGFLASVQRIASLTRSSGEAQRKVERAVITASENCREIYALTEAARSLEQASDVLQRVAYALREQVVGRIMA